MAACQYHPERSAIGVCVRCRTLICGACCTRLDGVNHCHACLHGMGRRADAPARGRGLAAAGTLGFLVVAWFALFAMLRWLQGSLAP